MEQKNAVEFVGTEGKIRLICDSDTPLGKLHDFLLMLKGNIVDRMVAQQKEEDAYSEEMKKQEECCLAEEAKAECPNQE